MSPHSYRHLPRWLLLAALPLLAVAVVLLWNPWSRQPKAIRELVRSELDLRDGVLFVRGEAAPFEGRLIENYAPGVRKLEIDVKRGKLHGRSVGWYRDGQMEVEERFVEGVSHGPRTRWYANGNKRSVAQIEHGKVTGQFTEWHDNGQRAVVMTVRDGQPDGRVEAWHPSGALKSRLRYEHGRQVEKQFWPDSAAKLAAAEN